MISCKVSEIKEKTKCIGFIYPNNSVIYKYKRRYYKCRADPNCTETAIIIWSKEILSGLLRTSSADHTCGNDISVYNSE